MKNSILYVDVHVLQSVPPSCINRDDTGSPKTATYGGVVRARVSSQSWKRAMRLTFKEALPTNELAFRTKNIVGLIAKEILVLDPKSEAAKLAQRILETAGLKIKSAEKGTDALFFISSAQAKALAELAVSDGEVVKEKPSKEAKAKVQNALRQSPSIDVALFGRMVADDPSLNTDACSQVAHSISTHKVSIEYDYFTAVDDLAEEDNAGASHLGTVEYNSATLYRYATVAVHELNKQLGDDTVAAVRHFLRAFVHSMPTGKQNTFANRTLPEAVLVTLRKDQPLNLVGAFERPVPASEDGYVAASLGRLVGHAKKLYASFATTPVRSFVAGEGLSELGQVQQFAELLDSLGTELTEQLGNGRDH
ncbi:MAG: type I-E CRISPR-associated protein Cas7/Cse4/CasC [Firmicutes bacterium]|nr:type I-E CRISPR-associated protein Cas7/Cse4/CasC [Dethiobacter sp.]MBS3888432.1 type I-E CRISPR-associated protein Cas7/Cse4/CasC [Bacillota bacterium]MBS4054571.1 type I-E CRISPR-associated protein Cas7/Cse4/CasC [Thermaerobacter sp.]